MAQDRRAHQLGSQLLRGDLRQWPGALELLEVGGGVLGLAGVLPAELDAGLMPEAYQPAL
jgi:hypothetical protein